MTDSKLIDSSIWLDYFIFGKFQDVIEGSAGLLLSSLSVFEIKKKLLSRNLSAEALAIHLEFLKKKSTVIPVTTSIAERAAEISIKHGLAAADSLIYATALLNNTDVVTADHHFQNLPHTHLM